MSQKTRKIAKTTTFEAALAELEGIVQTLETGDQTLEASLEKFERGVSLTRFCQQSLNEAEQKVAKLITNDDGQDELEALDAEQDGVDNNA